MLTELQYVMMSLHYSNLIILEYSCVKLLQLHCVMMTLYYANFLYGVLTSGKRPMGRPQLCYKDACKHESQSALTLIPGMLIANRSTWKQEVRGGLSKFGEGLTCQTDER